MWDIRLIYEHAEAWKGQPNEDKDVFMQAAGELVKERSAPAQDEG